MADRDWLDLAHGDLAAARALAHEDMLGQAAFHAHEAVEKALKSVITLHAVPARTHDLVRLAHDAAATEEIAARMDAFAGVYLGTRYPGMPVEFSNEVVDQMVLVAQEVIDWAETLFLRK